MNYIVQIVLGLLVFSLYAFGKVEFREKNYETAAKVDAPYEFALKPLLSIHDSSKPIIWLPGGNKPKWLKLDEKNHRLVGQPTSKDVGVFKFTLGASQFTSESATTISVTIYRPLRWKTTPIDFGKQISGQPFQIDLNRFVENPDNIGVQFRAEGLPSWMAADPDGLITGIPREMNIGPYQGISVTYETRYAEKEKTTASGVVAQIHNLPTWISSKIPLPEARERQVYKVNLSELVRNKENYPMQFRVDGPCPKWLTIAGNELTGTPQRSDAGSFQLRIEFTARIGSLDYHETTRVQLDVRRVDRAPSWTSNPLVVPSAFLSKAYRFEISSQINNPDKVEWLARMVGGLPDWLMMNSAGILTGTPEKADLGEVNLEVELVSAIDGEVVRVPGAIRLSVLPQNNPPHWTRDPLPLTQGTVGKSYRVDLTKFIEDLDPGDQLVFSSRDLPEWMKITELGILSGTPSSFDKGRMRFRLRATDRAGDYAEVRAEIIVDEPGVNHPPHFPANLTFRVKENDTLIVQLATAQYIYDPDGDPLEFEALQALPRWITVGKNGRVDANPRRADVGLHQVSLRVSDGQSKVDGRINVEVQSEKKPPVWLQDPISIEVYAGQSIRSPLFTHVRDFEGRPLQFQLIEGPNWLSLSTNGVLSGVAPETGGATFETKVRASNPDASADAVVKIVVKAGAKPITYFMSLLTDGLGQNGCAQFREAIENEIVKGFLDSGADVTGAYHRCNSANQYLGKLFFEATHEEAQAKMLEFARTRQNTWIGHTRVQLWELSSIKVDRSLSLLRRGVRIFDTNESSSESFKSIARFRDAIERESRDLKSGGQTAVLDVASRIFPSKFDVIKSRITESDGHTFFYKGEIDTTGDTKFIFEISSSDLILFEK